MSWDIYGEPLRRGHCEVHPHVHEEYPCSVCIADKRPSEQQGGCRGGCESEHLLGLAREHIEHLEQERDALAEKWGEVAALYARNADFYQGIVRRIGELFGEEARMSDDGSFQDDVLALKVPELVEALAAHVERIQSVERDETEYARNVMDILDYAPAISLALLKAQWQAEALEHASDRVSLAVEADTVRAHLRNQAAKLRQQAEGGGT